MDFSTPREGRSQDLSLEESPIETARGYDSWDRDDHCSSGGDSPGKSCRSGTNISNEVDAMVVAPPRVLTESSFERRLYGTAAGMEQTMNKYGLLKRAKSEQLINLSGNAFYNSFPTREPTPRKRAMS